MNNSEKVINTKRRMREMVKEAKDKNFDDKTNFTYLMGWLRGMEENKAFPIDKYEELMNYCQKITVGGAK